MEKFEVNSESYSIVEIDKVEPSSKEDAICTVICAALQKSGYFLSQGMFDRASLSLLDFLSTSDEVDKFYKSYSPIFYKNYKTHAPNSFKPIEICEVLKDGVNKWLGQEILSFKKFSSIQDIINDLDNSKCPVLLPIKYKDNSGLICITGYICKHLSEDKDIYYDTSNYTKFITLGLDNDILGKISKPKEYDVQELLSMCKPFNSKQKWCFTIKTPPETI